MLIRKMLPAVLLLIPFSLLPADEIELAYCESESATLFYQGANLRTNAAGTWNNGTDLLTDKALVFFSNGVLMTMDSRAEEADHHDTLYVDINENEAIDEGEAFPLAPRNSNKDFEPGSFTNPLQARKVPLVRSEAEEAQRFVNISLMKEGMQIYIGSSAWGCMKGSGMINGRECEVTLHDTNANGAFDDFETVAGQQADTLSLNLNDMSVVADQPLRQKMIVGESTFGVSLDGGCTRIAFEPIESRFGMVTVANDDMQVIVSSTEWGSHRILPKKGKKLPAGTYRIASFSVQQMNPFAYCGYKGPESVEIVVTPGNTAVIELETTLEAKVETSKAMKAINLSLQMTTSQGARFSGYSNAQSDPPGVPFFITDGAGNVVLESHFQFG